MTAIPYGERPLALLCVGALVVAGILVGLACHYGKPDTHSDYYRRKGRGE